MPNAQVKTNTSLRSVKYKPVEIKVDGEESEVQVVRVVVVEAVGPGHALRPLTSHSCGKDPMTSPSVT